MSESINPYAPPAAEVAALPQYPLRIGTIMGKAWRIFCERFGVIALIVMLVWVPCELLSSYMDTFVFGEDDLRKSFKFTQFLENFFGIIATAGVIHVALHHDSAERPGLARSFAEGLKNWPRMWWTRLLSSILLVLSLLLLVIPFFYLYPRLALTESVVVSEHLSGSAAMRRSQDLTHGRYWPVAGLLSLLVALYALPVAALILLSIMEVLPEHWLFDAGSAVALDVVSAYGTVCLFCMYEAFAEHAAAKVTVAAQ